MSTHTKIIVIVIAFVLLVYVAYKYLQPTEDPTATTDSTGKITKADAGITEPVTENFPLTMGMQGPNIKRMQVALNYIRPYNPVTTDGVFGSQTASKLYTSVDTSLSRQPITEAAFNKIIAMGNDVVLKR